MCAGVLKRGRVLHLQYWTQQRKKTSSQQWRLLHHAAQHACVAYAKRFKAYRDDLSRVWNECLQGPQAHLAPIHAAEPLGLSIQYEPGYMHPDKVCEHRLVLLPTFWRSLLDTCSSQG